MSRSQRIKQKKKKAISNLSKPMMCLNCHLIVQSKRNEEDDGWECPNCANMYLDKHWIIRRAK